MKRTQNCGKDCLPPLANNTYRNKNDRCFFIDIQKKGGGGAYVMLTLSKGILKLYLFEKLGGIYETE